jgi:DNA-binding LacI/PurR family transcriptional regulator
VKRPTILDVAERAGVSKSLVSLVMRDPDRVSDASRAAVLKAAGELGYRPNAVARSLVQQRSHVIGVVLSDLHNPFYADVAEKASVETLLERRVDGLIVTGATMDIGDLEEVAKSVPVTIVGRYTESQTIDMVGVDDVAGAREAVEHLIELGHRNIVHIDAGKAAGAPRRRTGYEQAMTNHGLADSIRTFPGAFTEAGGAKGMTDILNSGNVPTAVFAPNDAAALGAMDVIDSAGLRIPEDISLIGYDNLGIAGLPRIALTTVGQPRARLGEDAVKLVLERLQENRTAARHVVVPPSLVVRATTGPPRPA